MGLVVSPRIRFLQKQNKCKVQNFKTEKEKNVQLEDNDFKDDGNNSDYQAPKSNALTKEKEIYDFGGGKNYIYSQIY